MGPLSSSIRHLFSNTCSKSHLTSPTRLRPHKDAFFAQDFQASSSPWVSLHLTNPSPLNSLTTHIHNGLCCTKRSAGNPRGRPHEPRCRSQDRFPRLLCHSREPGLRDREEGLGRP